MRSATRTISGLPPPPNSVILHPIRPEVPGTYFFDPTPQPDRGAYFLDAAYGKAKTFLLVVVHQTLSTLFACLFTASRVGEEKLDECALLFFLGMQRSSPTRVLSPRGAPVAGRRGVLKMGVWTSALTTKRGNYPHGRTVHALRTGAQR